MDIKELIRAYIPVNSQEEKDKEAILDVLDNERDCFLRTNEKGHFTVSAWIVNKECDKVLFCYHKIYDSWSWTGGHADGETDLQAVAVKEAREETGIEPLQCSDEILSLEILPVAGHIKKGKYISSHIHYNVTFLVYADEDAPVRIKPDENTGLKWIPFSEVALMSTEKWMVDMIYLKIINKLSK